MDGIHDMGGKQGFGAVKATQNDPAFHYEWEARMWAISRNCRADDWTIDWWRHVRERIDPVDYLTRPYFDQWMQTSMAAFVLSGVFTLDEAINGHTKIKGTAAQKQDYAAAINANRALNRNFEVPAESPPRFSINDNVTTVAYSSTHHSRLPQYARSKSGKIHAYRGCHLFADAGAKGIHEGQHLYTVEFSSQTLWGDGAHPNDVTYLDLWESYFEY